MPDITVNLMTEAGMTKRRGQQTGRVVINVTPEQEAAVKATLRQFKATYGKSSNDALVSLLQAFCERYGDGIEWPEMEKQMEGKNFKRGAGGKFVKKSEIPPTE